ncbi:MAG: hypothetical protein ACRD2C_10205 [Acidimicrobiales bacterium]
MDRYYLEITVRVVDDVDVEALFDPLAEAVYDLVDVIDADLGARFGDREFDFTMTLDAEDAPSALGTGLTAVRTALHATGGATLGWERHFEAIRHMVQAEPAAA